MIVMIVMIVMVVMIGKGANEGSSATRSPKLTEVGLWRCLEDVTYRFLSKSKYLLFVTRNAYKYI